MGLPKRNEPSCANYTTIEIVIVLIVFSLPNSFFCDLNKLLALSLLLLLTLFKLAKLSAKPSP